MSQEEKKELTVYDYIDKAESKFEHAPLGMLFEQEKSYAVQLFAANDYLEKVARQSPISLLSAMANVASIGLSLNPAKKQAYLVPRGGKICLDPSYMGMCDLAIQSGTLEFVQAKAVYKNDTYINNGVDDKPSHSFDAFGDRGEVVGFYCVAKTVLGAYLTTEMSKADTDGIMNRSESGKKKVGPWMTDYVQMALKTVIRQAFKMWPKTEKLDRMALAVELSNENEEFEPLTTSPDLQQYTEEQKKYFDNLIERSDAIGMFCFIQQIGAGVYMSLYNSFDKDITKYKRIIGDLERDGSAQTKECKEQVEESARKEDDLGVNEVLTDLSQEAVAFITDNTDDETRQFIQKCQKELAA
jgi:phage RecT family recombinase